MTANQIAWQTMQEGKRHNVQTEKENVRHNVRTEDESVRHNVATEGETRRHNVATEFNESNKLIETRRHNTATENESRRHNVAGESISRYSEDIKLAQAAEAQRHNRVSEQQKSIDQTLQEQSTLVKQQGNFISGISNALSLFK